MGENIGDDLDCEEIIFWRERARRIMNLYSKELWDDSLEEFFWAENCRHKEFGEGRMIICGGRRWGKKMSRGKAACASN